MKIARIPLVVALAAALALAVSGLGVRAGFWPFPTGFRILGNAAYAGLVAAAAALLALAIPKIRTGAKAMLLLSIVLGLAVAYVPWSLQKQARALPPIHDISTDLADPPAFHAILARRAGAPNSADHGGEAVAQAQRLAYPDIQSLSLPLPPADAFSRAVAAARAMGWELVAEEPAAGRIEATAATRWFGFKDDVVIRVQPAAAGSKVDIRSVSRVGRGDAGANAKRIREYLARLAG
ncbi:MAG: hypothetical protein JWQ23_2592 [Herminiimonas sp.]|nr:hypothetical protein [Herminiimonas sp.]